MYHDRKLQPSSTTRQRLCSALFALALSGAAPVFAQDDSEEGVLDKAGDTAKAAGEYTAAKASQGWDATKRGAAAGAEAVTETSKDVWEGTKDGSRKAWEATKETSGDVAEYTAAKASQGWEKTKEIGASAADYGVQTYENVKEKLTAEDTPEVPVEDRSVD